MRQLPLTDTIPAALPANLVSHSSSIPNSEEGRAIMRSQVVYRCGIGLPAFSTDIVFQQVVVVIIHSFGFADGIQLDNNKVVNNTNKIDKYFTRLF